MSVPVLLVRSKEIGKTLKCSLRFRDAKEEETSSEEEEERRGIMHLNVERALFHFPQEHLRHIHFILTQIGTMHFSTTVQYTLYSTRL